MADPITMAVVGAGAGALMNKKDPLKGALLGAVGGYGGGALLGAGGAGATSAATGGFGAGGYGSIGLAGQTASAAAPTGFMANTMAGMGKDFTAVTDWAKANPMQAIQGAQTVQNVIAPEQQMQMPQAQLLRGTQMQQQAPAYAMARPNISLI